MAKKLFSLLLALGLLVSLFAACRRAGPAQPELSMFEPIALDTKPPYPMLYHIPFSVGQVGVGLIVNEKFETVAQLSPSEYCWYIYDRDAKPGTKDYVRFLCVSKDTSHWTNGEMVYDSEITVYDMSGSRVTALSDFGNIDHEIVDHHIVVGEWGNQGIYDLKNGKISLAAKYQSVEILGPDVAWVYGSDDRRYLMRFGGQVISAEPGIETAVYVDGVLTVKTNTGIGMMSLSGQWIVPPIYDTYRSGYHSGGQPPENFCDGYMAALRVEDGMLVFINKNGMVEESGEIPSGEYFGCYTYKDYFVISTDHTKVIHQNRVASQPLQEDEWLSYTDGFYFLHREEQLALFTFGGDLNFIDVGWGYLYKVVERNTEHYVILGAEWGRYGGAVYKIENGKLVEMENLKQTSPTADERFWAVSNGTAIGLVDDRGNWVFKTYKFYYLDDAYAETEWLDW